MKKYLITDPKYYSNDKQLFKDILTKAIEQHSPDIVCFRDKESQNIKELIEIFVKTCKQMKIQNIFINTYLNFALKYNATGIHLTSTQFDTIQLAKENNLEVIISCHNEDEIKQAVEQKVDFITYSPIYFTPNKGEPKGIKNLQEIVQKYPIKIIALGGIVTKEQINELEQTDIYGFASIRYFI